MNAMPFVSVIITTYNRKDYLEEAIDSVLNQIYSNFELIVVDDGSTDGTGDLIHKKYVGQLHYIYQENRGRSEARNHGMREAKGKYIAFLDSDDLWKPNKLSKQITFMEQNSQYGLTHTFVENIRDESKSDLAYTAWVHRLYQKALNRGYTYLGMSRHCVMFFSTIVVRAQIAQQIGAMDKACETYEDWDWYLRAALLTHIGTIEESLIWYRLHSENSSLAQFHAGQVAMAYKHLAQINQVPSNIRHKAKRNFYLQLASVAYHLEDKKECTRWVHKLLQIDPLILLHVENFRYLLTALLPSNWMHCLRSSLREISQMNRRY
ncbi:MAG: hypothetical protein DPW16_11185 [Chloroflexi bacterium]|nr:hypothetical protein [Chloroflexota bacterium]